MALNQSLIDYFKTNNEGQLSITSTMYSDKNRQVYRDTTEEETRELYNNILNEDKYTNAFARLMADKMGGIILFLIVFLSGYSLLYDKKYRMQEVIYAKQISSLTYILAKYLAIVILTVICCLSLVLFTTFVFLGLGAKYQYAIDIFAFFKYFVAWVFPTILFGAALGMLVSVLTGSGIIAILMHFFFFFLSVVPLYGDYRIYKAVIRCNGIGGYYEYKSWYNSILYNRIFYTIITAIMIVIIWWTFDYNRNKIVDNKGKKGPLWIELKELRTQVIKILEWKNNILHLHLSEGNRFSFFGNKVGYSFNLIKYNFKIACKANSILSIFLFFGIYIFFRNDMDDMDITYLAEHFVSIIGIPFFVSIGNIEKQIGCYDIISIRGNHLLSTMRMCMVAAISFSLTSVFLWLLATGKPVETKEIIIGTWITGAYLGMIGMLVTRLMNNIIVGYLVSFGYYILAFLTNDGLFQGMPIFSLSSGNDFEAKYHLLEALVIIFLVSVIMDIKMNRLLFNRNKLH